MDPVAKWRITYFAFAQIMTSTLLYTAILLSGGIQGLFLGSRLLSRKMDRGLLFLFLFIFANSISLVTKIGYETQVYATAPQLTFIADLTLFAYGPFLFLFFRHRLFQQDGFRLSEWLHFVPALLHFSYYVQYMCMGTAELHQVIADPGHEMFQVWGWTEGLAVVQNLAYALAGLALLRRYSRRSKAELSQSLDGGLLSPIVYFSLLTMVVWGIGWLSIRLGAPVFGNYFVYNAAWILLSMTSFVVAWSFMGRYQSLRRLPAVDQDEAPEAVVLAFQGGRLEEENSELALDAVKLKRFVAEEKAFLDPQLDLQGLASRMNWTSHHLSAVINKGLERNFSQFINEYRVAEFIARRGELDRLTILALALECGFNSKTTFNTAFRRAKSCSPTAYLRQLKPGEAVQ